MHTARVINIFVYCVFFDNRNCWENKRSLQQTKYNTNFVYLLTITKTCACVCYNNREHSSACDKRHLCVCVINMALTLFEADQKNTGKHPGGVFKSYRYYCGFGCTRGWTNQIARLVSWKCEVMRVCHRCHRVLLYASNIVTTCGAHHFDVWKKSRTLHAHTNLLCGYNNIEFCTGCLFDSIE